jgi:hypothetical protein
MAITKRDKMNKRKADMQAEEAERRKKRHLENIVAAGNATNKRRGEFLLKQYTDIINYLKLVLEDELDTQRKQDDMVVFQEASDLLIIARDKFQVKQNEFIERWNNNS